MERIVSVGVRLASGEVHEGALMERHHHVIHRMCEQDLIPDGTETQGFVTNFGRFVDRKEAWKIALAAGQIKESPTSGGALYSEDMW